MFLKKHYEIPFLKECAVLFICYISLIERDNHQQESIALFPLSYLVKNATGYIAELVTPHRLYSITSNPYSTM